MRRCVTVDYDAATALLVVDVQNDFADPAGALYVREGERVVPLINAEIERALAAGAAIVYTRDCHPPVTPHFRKDGGLWPVHCVRDTPGAELHPALRRVDAPVVLKGTDGRDGYSAFSVRDPSTGETGRTELELLLRERGVERVVVAGLATDYCVRESVLDARRLGFEATVLVDAVRAVDLRPGDGERALAELARAGARLERAGA